MANGRRSIYSRRQSMPAGTYDNPLADFLDALPQYINQYQQNQLRMKQYEDTIKQREYNNELNLYRLLPDEVRSEAMSKSDNEEISQIGTKAVNNKKAFLDQLNFTDINKSDVEMLDYYNNLSMSPNVAGNTKRENQVKNKIISLENKIKKEAIIKYYDDNPDSKFKNIDLQRAQYEPDEVIKDLNDRTLKTVSNELPTPTATLEGLGKLLSLKSRQGLNRSTMTVEEAKEYDAKLKDIETRMEELTGLRKPTKKTLPNF